MTPTFPTATVWLTGLSGAGKSTIGIALVEELRRQGRAAVLLDGDEIRLNLTKELGFERQDRDEQVERVGWLCELLNRNDVIAVAALVSPFRDARERVRSRIPVFVEVHVDAPLEVLAQRDPKGYYQRSRDGAMPGLTGVDAPYEPPLMPEVVCLTSGSDGVASCVKRILERIGDGSYVHGTQEDAG